jgi:hypothetical protein
MVSECVDAAAGRRELVDEAVNFFAIGEEHMAFQRILLNKGIPVLKQQAELLAHLRW